MFTILGVPTPTPDPPPITLPSVDWSKALEPLKDVAKTVQAKLPGNSEEFLHRLFSDWWRLGICAIVAFIVWGAITASIGKSKGSGILKVAAIFAGIGSIWITWLIYNSVTHKTTALFTDQGGPASYLDAFHLTGGAFWATVIGLAIGCYTAFVIKAGVIKSVFVGICVWVGANLLYNLILVQWLGIH